MARGLSLRRLNADKKTISLVCADQVSTRIFHGSLSERISLIRPWRGLEKSLLEGLGWSQPLRETGQRDPFVQRGPLDPTFLATTFSLHKCSKREKSSFGGSAWSGPAGAMDRVDLFVSGVVSASTFPTTPFRKFLHDRLPAAATQKTNQRRFLKSTSRAPVTTRLAPRRRARRRQKEALDLLVKKVGKVSLDRGWLNDHNKNVCNLDRFVFFSRRLGSEDPQKLVFATYRFQ